MKHAAAFTLAFTLVAAPLAGAPPRGPGASVAGSPARPFASAPSGPAHPSTASPGAPARATTASHAHPNARPKPPRGASPASIAIAGVDVVVRRGAALVTTDVTFSRGAYRGGDLDVFVAYGSPGIPRAFDAHLIGVPEGYFRPATDDNAIALETAHATHAPDDATFAVGPVNRAGQVVRVPGSALVRALALSGLVAVRLRAVHTVAEGRPASLLVRVSSRAGPLPLGPITVRGQGAGLAQASAELCASEAAPTQLALVGVPVAAGARVALRAPRTAADELCVSATLETP